MWPRPRREDGLAKREKRQGARLGEASRRESLRGHICGSATFGEVVVLATLGVANESALKMAGAETLCGKVVIDATNPLDFSGGMPPKVAVSGNDSASNEGDVNSPLRWAGRLQAWGDR